MPILLIVESPTKAKTIGKFLGKEYDVESSFGHIRDLPKGQMGVDIEHDFEPTYEVSEDKKDKVKVLKAAAKKASAIYLTPIVRPEAPRRTLGDTLKRGFRYLLGDAEKVPAAAESVTHLQELAGVGITHLFALGNDKLDRERERLTREISANREDQAARSAAIDASQYLTRARKEELKAELSTLAADIDGMVGDGREAAYRARSTELARSFMDSNPQNMTALAALGFMLDNRVARSLHDAAARFRGLVPSSSQRRAEETMTEWFRTDDEQLDQYEVAKDQHEAVGLLGRRVGYITGGLTSGLATSAALAVIIGRLHEDVALPHHTAAAREPVTTSAPTNIDTAVVSAPAPTADTGPTLGVIGSAPTEPTIEEKTPLITYGVEAKIRPGDGLTSLLRRVVKMNPDQYPGLSSSDELTSDLNISRMLARDGLLDKWLGKVPDNIYIIPKIGKDGQWHATIIDNTPGPHQGDELTYQTAKRRGIIIPSPTQKETAP